MTMGRALAGLAIFLTMVPVTLLVPGLHELVVGAHGGTLSDAHSFMTVNMVAGMLTVPAAMRILSVRGGNVRTWAQVALLIDAVAFAGMAFASSLTGLFAFRILDGAVHLPAITFLMVIGNRLAGSQRRGATLGLLATAIMAGVAVGSPLGGNLVSRGPAVLYLTGAALLVLAAMVVGFLPAIDGVSRRTASRYEWQGSRLVTWIPLAYAFLDRFSVGIFVSTFTLYLTNVIGLSPSRRGALIALFMVPFAVLCYPAGRLAGRAGWLRPMLVGNICYGLTFACYGLVPSSWLPAAMLASGVFSALMFAPNLVMISDLARHGAGEGLFGAFQVAGSLGFLFGPVVGGLLVSTTRGADGVPAYAAIFAGVGVCAVLLAVVTWVTCRQYAHGVAPAMTKVSPALVR